MPLDAGSVNVTLHVKPGSIEAVHALSWRKTWLALKGAESPEAFYAAVQEISMESAKAEERVVGH